MENFTSKKFGIWFDFKIQPENEWMKFFDMLENANISECFINANANQLDYLISLTKNYNFNIHGWIWTCLLYTSPSPRDATLSRMPSSA